MNIKFDHWCLCAVLSAIMSTLLAVNSASEWILSICIFGSICIHTQIYIRNEHMCTNVCRYSNAPSQLNFIQNFNLNIITNNRRCRCENYIMYFACIVCQRVSYGWLDRPGCGHQTCVCRHGLTTAWHGPWTNEQSTCVITSAHSPATGQ